VFGLAEWNEPNEKNITDNVMKLLKKQPGGFAVKLHGGRYQKSGLPDVLFIQDGTVYFFEVKRPGNKLTKLQADTMKRLCKAGAFCYTVFSAADVKAALKEGDQ